MNSSISILLVDDEPTLRRATALLLTGRGGCVCPVGTADEAVALSGAHLFDVAIFDLSSSSPSDALRRIRSRGLVPRRVIAVSSGPLEGDEAAQFTEVLPRPYPFDRLLRAVFGGRGGYRTRTGVAPRAAAGRSSRSYGRSPAVGRRARSTHEGRKPEPRPVENKRTVRAAARPRR